ncbi:hypothetical protein MUU48_11290 [Scandinavium sp. H11S7]|uniref:Uncharacterized protein n=1 Tax=Scandinavium hiltneri TaxID=2926519 RepID=A0ABT2E2T8_9ENTR|nr:hypothetical protein [Scandinavium hiltneri]MCS2157495.1 hypothetical protein [Scandinavium hiltneri]MCS2162194.1 hypothetical protein [Scandinavium hiltneri]
MNIYVILSITLSVKILLSYALYKKHQMAFKRMSLPTKSAVIGSGWLATYGLFQLLEGII